MNAKDIARFWAKVDKSGDCWEWTAGKDPKGYGQFAAYLPGMRGPSKAHRIAYLLTHGSLTPGLLVDHKCHNKGCVNPEHLREVTNKQNQENAPGARGKSKSGLRGVMWCSSSGKWIAQVRHHGVRHRRGPFETIEQANSVAIALRNDLYTHNDADRVERAA